MPKLKCFLVRLTLFIVLLSASAHAATWEPVKDPKEIAALFSDTVVEATLNGEVKATATYKSDGTGVVEAWGDKFKRTWKIKGNDQVCIGLAADDYCYQFERSTTTKDLYRATNLTTGEKMVLTIRKAGDKKLKIESPTTASGGAVKPSAEEMAAKLANPNAPLATLNFKLQFRTYEGSLPNANGQSGTTLLFQPTFPFSLDNGDVIFFRPAFPLIFDQPVYNGGSGNFDAEAGLGDIAFDLAYGRTTKTGFLWAVGAVSTLPTATNNKLSKNRWTLGPELLIGKISKKNVLIAFPSHQWDVGGSGTADVNLTTLQLIYTHLPGGGWSVGTAPLMTFDHVTNESTIPLNLTFGKTVIWNGRPWKLGMEINYYVDKPDAFGPTWMVGFTVGPVVENMFANWFK